MPERTCSFSGLRQLTCAHCKHPRRVLYELRPGVYMGNPVVEILKNGGPVHPYDEHFRFGLAKGRLLLAALDAIRQFAAVGDDIVERFTSEGPPQGIASDALTIWIELHPEFVRSTGETVDRPWLHMRSSTATIGVGYEKAKAVCALSDQLRQWVEEATFSSNRLI